MLINVLTAGCADKTWDYVALGDSYPAGLGVENSYVDYYAEFIEQDLGVQVEVHNFSRNYQSASLLLYQLRNKQELRDAIKDAEVITIYTGWDDLNTPLELYPVELCGGEDNLDCIREEVAKLKTDIDAILDEILSLSSVQDTLIRIADTNIPFANSWIYKGWFEILRGPCYEEWREHLIGAAERRGITVVYTYYVLNGPNGDQPTKDSITQDDGIHVNEEGHRLIARLHREAGYEYAP
ncbi:MAG: SGNH/GDSL hydrolase family protein [Candidatus Thorarchaeota archaeon]